MKKLFFILVAAIVAANVMAQQHEIGVIAGGMNGLSYKYWCSDQLAVQTDLAVGMTAAAGGTYYKGSQLGSGTASVYDFTVNPNLQYHFPLTSNLHLYTGGGLNFGLLSDLQNTNPNYLMGKFGLNGVVGLSLFVNKVALAFDFRPGYGLGFTDSNAPHFSFFDWKLAIAVRYRI